jgi:F-type H+-transporting ATPase subunit b
VRARDGFKHRASTGKRGAARRPELERIWEVEQLGINLPALIAQLINFGLLIFLLRAVAYKPILRILDDRAERVRQSLAEAERVREEAKRNQEDLNARRQEALRQSQEIVTRANQAAERIQSDALADARRAADEFLERSRAEIDRERQRAIAEIRSQMAGLAILAASRVVRRSLDQPEHYRIIEEALAEAEKANLS